jgi:hypothetical protein
MFKCLIAALALSAGISLCVGATDDDARVPVLLELFTSEGCSSCPPADRLLEVLDQKQPAAGADLIVLSEHVDYWDRLGWKDPFSSSQYTSRQQEYASKFNTESVYTPQLVVDGRFGIVGSDAAEAASAIRKAIREPKIPIGISNIARAGNQVTALIELPAVRDFKGGRAILYVAIADNRAESHVARGENAGRSLTHVAVTRILKQWDTVDLDHAAAREITLPIQLGTDGSRLIAFLEDPRSGHILGVVERKLP